MEKKAKPDEEDFDKLIKESNRVYAKTSKRDMYIGIPVPVDDLSAVPWEDEDGAKWFVIKDTICDKYRSAEPLSSKCAWVCTPSVAARYKVKATAQKVIDEYNRGVDVAYKLADERPNPNTTALSTKDAGKSPNNSWGWPEE
jgi:hypothetical protein